MALGRGAKIALGIVGGVVLAGCCGCAGLFGLGFFGAAATDARREDSVMKMSASICIVELEKIRIEDGEYPVAKPASCVEEIGYSRLAGDEFEIRYLEASIGPFPSDCYNVYDSKTASWTKDC